MISDADRSTKDRLGKLLGSKAVGSSISGQYKSSEACWKDQNVSPKVAKNPNNSANYTLGQAACPSYLLMTMALLINKKSHKTGA
jgi:hypothetical protein